MVHDRVSLTLIQFPGRLTATEPKLITQLSLPPDIYYRARTGYYIALALVQTATLQPSQIALGQSATLHKEQLLQTATTVHK